MSKAEVILGVTSIGLSAAGGIIAGSMTQKMVRKEIEKFDMENLTTTERNLGPLLAGATATYNTTYVLMKTCLSYANLIIDIAK